MDKIKVTGEYLKPYTCAVTLIKKDGSEHPLPVTGCSIHFDAEEGGWIATLTAPVEVELEAHSSMTDEEISKQLGDQLVNIIQKD